MVQKINSLPTQNPSVAEHNNFIRMVATKEEHAQICKREILILWTDYFKPEHLSLFPDLHDVFWNTAKLCSKNKQTVDEQASHELVAAVDKISIMFQKAEGEKKKTSSS